ncbi:MAG: zf-HC2 domain-containing protein [Deltaproteobacteria bacterium]|nr:zf-HC2 domain-containing protein [Deltaproteobacteria bacterium]
MKWRCKLLQRWLPGYLDGDAPVFWRRRVEAHLEHCPACRREAEALKEAAAALQSAPVEDPGPAFWQEFNRELHLKLVQANQASPEPQRSRFRMPYYAAAAAGLAVLVVWIAYQVPGPHQTGPAPRMALEAQPAPEAKAPKLRMAKPPAAPVPALPAETSGPVSFASLGDEEMDSDDDVLTWDPDPVLADLTDQEREKLLKRLKRQEEDGSWQRKSYSVFWA